MAPGSPEPLPVLPLEERVPALERMMLGIKRELQTIREDMQNVLKAANMASEDAQKVALRMDALEYEWLLWNDS